MIGVVTNAAFDNRLVSIVDTTLASTIFSTTRTYSDGIPFVNSYSLLLHRDDYNEYHEYCYGHGDMIAIEVLT
jgi:hypothetical protein